MNEVGQGNNIEPGQQKNKPKRGCLFIFLIIAATIFCCFVIFIFLIAVIAFSSGVSLPGTAIDRTSFKEVYISGKENSPNKIAVIHIDGIICLNDYPWGKTANVKTLSAQLREAGGDYQIKAVLLNINSPGGEVAATDILHHEIEKVRMKKPVAALLGPVAASGGYYTAVAADYIIANRFTITGSIGVIINNFNYYQLLQKIGVHDEVYKSRDMKDLLNPARPRTKAEEIIIQALISESYNEFVEIVSKGRIDKYKILTVDYIKKSEIGDGRIFSGGQAFKLGLIDQLGYFDDAVDKTADMAHLVKNNYQLITYQKPFSFSDLLQKFINRTNSITVNIPALTQYFVLEPGKLYYLYTGMK